MARVLSVEHLQLVNQRNVCVHPSSSSIVRGLFFFVLFAFNIRHNENQNSTRRSVRFVLLRWTGQEILFDEELEEEQTVHRHQGVRREIFPEVHLRKRSISDASARNFEPQISDGEQLENLQGGDQRAEDFR